ncbi:MAG: transcriptional regulator [Ferruginibacter sp.]
MSSLKNIREKFGISQEDAASWLGISRSLVALYERGIRNLPTHALLQLGRLEMMVVEFEKDDPELKTPDSTLTGSRGSKSSRGYEASSELPEPLKPLEHNLHPRLAVELNKANRLQQQLSVIKNRHAVLHQQMLLIKKMMDNCDKQTNEKEKLWLQMLYHGVCCKLSKFDESKQLPLKAKIMVMRIKQELMDKKTG